MRGHNNHNNKNTGGGGGSSDKNGQSQTSSRQPKGLKGFFPRSWSAVENAQHSQHEVVNNVGGGRATAAAAAAGGAGGTGMVSSQYTAHRHPNAPEEVAGNYKPNPKIVVPTASVGLSPSSSTPPKKNWEHQMKNFLIKKRSSSGNKAATTDITHIDSSTIPSSTTTSTTTTSGKTKGGGHFHRRSNSYTPPTTAASSPQHHPPTPPGGGGGGSPASNSSNNSSHHSGTTSTSSSKKPFYAVLPGTKRLLVRKSTPTNQHHKQHHHHHQDDLDVVKPRSNSNSNSGSPSSPRPPPTPPPRQHKLHNLLPLSPHSIMKDTNPVVKGVEERSIRGGKLFHSVFSRSTSDSMFQQQQQQQQEIIAGGGVPQPLGGGHRSVSASVLVDRHRNKSTDELDGTLRKGIDKSYSPDSPLYKTKETAGTMTTTGVVAAAAPPPYQQQQPPPPLYLQQQQQQQPYQQQQQQQQPYQQQQQNFPRITSSTCIVEHEEEGRNQPSYTSHGENYNEETSSHGGGGLDDCDGGLDALLASASATVTMPTLRAHSSQIFSVSSSSTGQYPSSGMLEPRAASLTIPSSSSWGHYSFHQYQQQPPTPSSPLPLQPPPPIPQGEMLMQQQQHHQNNNAPLYYNEYPTTNNNNNNNSHNNNHHHHHGMMVKEDGHDNVVEDELSLPLHAGHVHHPTTTSESTSQLGILLATQQQQEQEQQQNLAPSMDSDNALTAAATAASSSSLSGLSLSMQQQQQQQVHRQGNLAAMMQSHLSFTGREDQEDVAVNGITKDAGAGPADPELKKAFTAFHNASKFAKDAASPFLGDDPNLASSYYLQRDPAAQYATSSSYNYNMATSIMTQHNHYHQQHPSSAMTQMMLLQAGGGVNGIVRGGCSVPQHALSERGFVAPINLSTSLPPGSVDEQNISIHRSLRLLKPIEAADTWQTGRRYLISPATLAACPLSVVTSLSGSKNARTVLEAATDIDRDGDASCFGMIDLGEALITYVGEHHHLSLGKWSSCRLVLRQNFLLEYDSSTPIQGLPRGFAHLHYAFAYPHDDFPDALELQFFASPCAKADQRVLMIRVKNREDRDHWITCLNDAAQLQITDLYDYDERFEFGRGRYAGVYPARRKTKSYYNSLKPLVADGESPDKSTLLSRCDCALKIVDKNQFWSRVVKGRERADTLVRETSVQATLTSKYGRTIPTFLQIRGFFETSDHVVMELELLEGTDLFDYVSSKGVLSEKEAASILRDMLLSLDAMNRVGLAHRDVKPANVLMCNKEKDGVTAKVGDFGMSTFVGVDGLVRGRCGTPGYVAPEMLTAGSRASYGNKVDVFSAGVTLYVMLCGYEPFYGETERDLVEANRQAAIDFPESDWKNVSHDARDLVLKMTKRDPSERLSAKEALGHFWITSNTADDVAPAPNTRSDLPEVGACVIS